MVRSRIWGIASLCAVFVASPVLAQETAPPTKPDTNPAAADPSPDFSASKVACIAAHSETQQLRQRGQLLAAKERSNVCVKDECPSLIRQECADLLLHLEEQIPSVVILATSGGGEAIEKLTLKVDGMPIQVTSGKALQLDPGEHQIQAEASGFRPTTSSFVVFEGQRYREVSVRLLPLVSPPTPSQTRVPQPRTISRPVPPWTFALAGVGVAALASFGVWAYLGNKEEDELQRRCSPNCNDNDLSIMNTRYAVADVSLAVGGVALGAAVLTYVLRPTRESASPDFQVQAGPGSLSARIRF